MPTKITRRKPSERRKRMKRIEQAIVGLLVMMFALTACSNEDAPEANGGKVINRKEIGRAHV